VHDSNCGKLAQLLQLPLASNATQQLQMHATSALEMGCVHECAQLWKSRAGERREELPATETVVGCSQLACVADPKAIDPHYADHWDEQGRKDERSRKEMQQLAEQNGLLMNSPMQSELTLLAAEHDDAAKKHAVWSRIHLHTACDEDVQSKNGNEFCTPRMHIS
jgi:hypothetical protein